jgi:enolase-phosphatase E1
MADKVTRFADICGTLAPMDFYMNTTNDFLRANGVATLQTSERAREIADEIMATAEIRTDERLVEFVADQIKAHNLDKTYMELDGIVTSAGYDSGELETPFFEDVEPAFDRWQRNGDGIFTYSSGSEQSQREGFAHGVGGRDLTGFIDGYFDKTWGEKDNPDTYKLMGDEMAKRIDGSPGEMVFYTDMLKELDAASEAGWTPVLVERRGNKPLDEQPRMDGSVGGDFNYRRVETLAGE